MEKLTVGSLVVMGAALTMMGCAVDTATSDEPSEPSIGVTQQALVSLALRNDFESDVAHPTSNLVTDGPFGYGCGFIGWCGEYRPFFTGTIQLPALKLESKDGDDDQGYARIVWGPVTIPADGDYVIRTGTTMYVDLSTRVEADSFLYSNNENASTGSWLEYRAKLDSTYVWTANQPVLSDQTWNEERTKSVRSRFTVPTNIAIRGARAGQQVRVETTLKMANLTVGNGTLARVSVRKFGLEANLASQPVGRLEQ